MFHKSLDEDRPAPTSPYELPADDSATPPGSTELPSTASGLGQPLGRTSSALRRLSGEATSFKEATNSPPQPKTAGKHDSDSQSPWSREGDPFAQHSPAIHALEKVCSLGWL